MRKVAVLATMVLGSACAFAAGQPLGEWLEDRFDGIHLLAKIGAPGVLLAACVGLYLFLRKPVEAKRHKIRWVHLSIAIVSGLIVATHALGFDTHHFLMDSRAEMLRSGTWLGLTVVFLLITGALRFWAWHHHGLWRWSHRSFQVLFLVAVCVHVLPKIMHAPMK